MRYPDEYDMTQMMGLGEFVGEIRQGPDGATYQWVQGVDGLGNPVGFWKRIKRAARRVKKAVRKVRRVSRRAIKKALPIATAATAFLPFPGARAVSAGLRVATPWLRRAGVAGHEGMGALYETPDGSLYQMQGLADDYDDMQGLADGYTGLADDDLTEIMGIGQIGDLSIGPNNYLYEWEEGVDGLGNPVGRWRPYKKLRARLRRVKRQARRLARRAGRSAVRAATNQIPVPGVRRLAQGALKQAGVAGYDGLGALYATEDGMVYQMQGLADGYDMEGLADDYDDIEGLADYDDMEGLADYDDIEGLADYDDMEGYVPHPGETLYGIDDGSEEDDLEGYVPHRPPVTQVFQRPAEPPTIWQAPW